MTFWIIDKEEAAKLTAPEPVAHPSNPETPDASGMNTGNTIAQPSSAGSVSTPNIEDPEPETVKELKQLTISGKVPLENYTQLFTSFIRPLAQNDIEIEVKIKAKSTANNPITENGQLHQVIKESAKQLGLKLE